MKHGWRTTNDDDDLNEYYNEITATHNDEPSMTMQGFTDDADINQIVRRYGIKDGALPPAAYDWENLDLTQFGDETDLPSVLRRQRAIEDAFAMLPAEVRAKFDNRYTNLWSALVDENRRDEMEQLGFWRKEKETPKPPSADNPPTG